MKDIEEILNLLKEGYQPYISSNSIDFLPYFKNIAEKVPPMKNSPSDKILIFAHLTSIAPMSPEIIISKDFTVGDHRGAGAINNTLCVTVFIKSQDIKMKETLKEFQALMPNLSAAS